MSVRARPDKHARHAILAVPTSWPDDSPFRFVWLHGFVHLVRQAVGPPFSKLCHPEAALVIPRRILLSERPAGLICPGCAERWVTDPTTTPTPRGDAA